RQKFELQTVAGGVALGAVAAFGLGIGVVNVDADVSAFIAPGTTVNGLGGAGDLSVEAQLDSTVKVLGFAGSGSFFIALGSAVSGVNDTSNVRALLGARVNGSGAVEQGTAGTGADIGKLAGFANVLVDAVGDRLLRIATGAGDFSVGGAVGIAMTSARVSGAVE